MIDFIQIYSFIDLNSIISLYSCILVDICVCVNDSISSCIGLYHHVLLYLSTGKGRT